jgi:ribonuclease HI
MIERVLPLKKPAVVDRITIHFDGIVYQTAPYPSSWAFLVRLNGDLVFQDSGPIPDLTEYSGNDVIAKFLGLHESLRWLNQQNRFEDHVVVMGDNHMVMGSMEGSRPPPDNKKFLPLWQDCRKLASPFFKIQFVWITKQENRECRDWSIAQIEKMRNPV